MDKNSSFQLELFSKDSSAFKIRNQPAVSPFAKFLRGYEKKALLVVGILIIGIISFSLGVQKGRRISIAQQQQQPFVKTAIKNTIVEQIHPQQNSNLTYTIQLASYKGKACAEKEAQALKKKGLVPIILIKGNYAVLYAGSFADRKTAQINLTEFRKTYRDCCIREIDPKSPKRKQI